MLISAITLARHNRHLVPDRLLACVWWEGVSCCIEPPRTVDAHIPISEFTQAHACKEILAFRSVFPSQSHTGSACATHMVMMDGCSGERVAGTFDAHTSTALKMCVVNISSIPLCVLGSEGVSLYTSHPSPPDVSL